MKIFVHNKLIDVSRYEAVAIEVKSDHYPDTPRFFYGFGKNGRIKTAWSLAGARLFGSETDIAAAEKRINAKGRETTRRLIFSLNED